MKRVWEKIVEGILTCSGFVTSITISVSYTHLTLPTSDLV